MVAKKLLAYKLYYEEMPFRIFVGSEQQVNQKFKRRDNTEAQEKNDNIIKEET